VSRKHRPLSARELWVDSWRSMKKGLRLMIRTCYWQTNTLETCARRCTKRGGKDGLAIIVERLGIAEKMVSMCSWGRKLSSGPDRRGKNRVGHMSGR